MRKALLVGINKYKIARNNLRGCINDIIDIYDLLINTYNFKRKDIMTLTDERATFENITTFLNKILKSFEEGLFIFYYSGHGSQIADFSGDEEDFLDEIIVTHEMDFNRPLSDDIIGEIIKKYSNKINIYFIMDCCHSGSITRSLTSLSDMIEKYEKQELFENMFGAHVNRYDRGKFIIPPLEVLLNQENIHQKTFSKVIKTIEMGHTCMSAAKSSQVALETAINGKPRGAFTYLLSSILRKHPNINIDQLHKQILSNMIKYSKQEPSFESINIQQKIFT